MMMVIIVIMRIIIKTMVLNMMMRMRMMILHLVSGKMVDKLCNARQSRH